MKSQIAGQLSGIVGYDDYIAGRAEGLAGVVVRGRALSIKLTEPNGRLCALRIAA